MITSVTGRRFGAAAVVALVLAALVAAPVAVLAHAELETVTPADRATLTEAPIEIVMTFSEVLDPARSSIVVAMVGGGEVASGGVVDTTADATRMTLALPALAAGEYEIRWTSASAVDGDLDRGTTMFSYAPPPAPTPSATVNAPPSPTPPASPASSASPSASPAPSADGTAASSTDVIVPIVAAIVVLAALGGWLLSQSRGRGPA